MALSTYVDLKAAIANWLRRTDLTDRIPEFIVLADARIRREQEWDIRLYTAETGNPIAWTAQGMQLPNGVMRVKDLWPAAGVSLKALKQVTFAELRRLADSNADAPGTPTHYAVLPGRDPLAVPARLYLWPQPNAGFTFDILYVNDVGSLGSGGNDLLTFAPDIYMWAALAESAPFLKHDDRAGVWEAKYQNTLTALNLQYERAAHGASTRQISIREFS